ncbi:MAG TPA: diguanylate cyclase response regulator [Spirochaetota bacterium]|nr:diguanylate cyclase response regulator [Spirochaetota bacterium]HPV40479.1 diguanylate cyclase response regulator [Spirochaetota bacterium]
MQRAETFFKVLVVTDNRILAASMQEYLAGSRYSAAVCSGRTGIVRAVADAIKKDAVDIVVIDMAMLVSAGRELVRTVRKAEGRPDIVMIGGGDLASLNADEMKKADHDFVPPEIDRDHLLSLLEQAADRRQRIKASQEPDPYRQTSLIDRLTGLYNRSYFRERVEQEISAARRKRGDFSILLIEIRDLKIINEDLGRHAGDDVLKRVSASLQEHCRGCDTIARCGGDEFGIILSEASVEGAKKIAERILSSFTADRDSDSSGRPITASIGISSYPQHAEDSEGLLRKADLALRASRSAGGNRYSLGEN